MLGSIVYLLCVFAYTLVVHTLAYLTLCDRLEPVSCQCMRSHVIILGVHIVRDARWRADTPINILKQRRYYPSEYERSRQCR